MIRLASTVSSSTLLFDWEGFGFQKLSESHCCGISQSNCIVKDQADIDSNYQAADLKKNKSVNSEELDSVAINGHLICWELTGESV